MKSAQTDRRILLAALLCLVLAGLAIAGLITGSTRPPVVADDSSNSDIPPPIPEDAIVYSAGAGNGVSDPCGDDPFTDAYWQCWSEINGIIKDVDYSDPCGDDPFTDAYWQCWSEIDEAFGNNTLDYADLCGYDINSSAYLTCWNKIKAVAARYKTATGAGDTGPAAGADDSGPVKTVINGASDPCGSNPYTDAYWQCWQSVNQIIENVDHSDPCGDDPYTDAYWQCRSKVDEALGNNTLDHADLCGQNVYSSQYRACWNKIKAVAARYKTATGDSGSGSGTDTDQTGSTVNGSSNPCGDDPYTDAYWQCQSVIDDAAFKNNIDHNDPCSQTVHRVRYQVCLE